MVKKLNTQNRYYLAGFLSIIVAHLTIISRLTFFPYPELFIYPYLTNIGLVPYSQIFDQHFPGVMFFPVNLGTLGIVQPQSALILHLTIIFFIHILLFIIAVKLSKSYKTALLASFMYLIWHPILEGNSLWIDSFLPLLLLPSYYLLVIVKENNKSIFFSGFFLGAALVMKQVILPLIIVLFLVFIVKREFKKSFIFIIGCAVLPALMLVYILNSGIFSDFFFWTVKFNLTTFAQMGRKYGSIAQLARISILYLPAILIALIYSFKKREYFILLIYILGSLFFSYARFDYIHLQPSIVFAILATVPIVTKLNKNFYISMVIVYILIMTWFVKPFYTYWGDGGVKFFDPYEYKLADKIASLTVKGDPIFAFATTPHIYSLTNTRPSGNVFVFHFPWFMTETQEKVLNGLKNDPPKVIIRDLNATTDGKLLINYMSSINAYVNDNYEITDNINGIEVMIPIK